jgi:hypothetical protein
MTKNTILFFLLFVIAILIYSLFQLDLIKIYEPCTEAIEIKNTRFAGALFEKKDTDPHFKSRYLVVEDELTCEKIELVLTHDSNINKETGRSLLWERMDIGDSLTKDTGNFVVHYKKHESSMWESKSLGFTLCH